jgi:cytochrome c oxidase subunit II
MAQQEKRTAQRILIASTNPLFGRGLEKMLRQRTSEPAPEICITTSMAETLARLDEWKPDRVIVDYDDRAIDRGQFLSHFVSTDRPMQVMLVSLQANGAVVVYDRKLLTSAQAEDWLNFSADPPILP